MSKHPYPLWSRFQDMLVADNSKWELRGLIWMGCAVIALLALVIDNTIGLAALAAYIFLP